MKPQKKTEREFDVAQMECKSEFGSIYNDSDVIDELAMAEVEDSDE